jgi:hypothetical protein
MKDNILEMLASIVQVAMSVAILTLMYNGLGAEILGTSQLDWDQVWAVQILISAVVLPPIGLLHATQEGDTYLEILYKGIFISFFVYCACAAMLYIVGSLQIGERI